MEEEMSRTDILRIVANEILLSEEFMDKMSEKIIHQLELEHRQLIDNLTSCIVHLEDENDCIRTELELIRFSIHRLEQHARKNNIRIFGVPEEPKEDTDKVVADICEKYFNMKIDKSQINKSRRIGAVQKDRNRSILVKFVNHRDKMAVFRRKRFLKSSGIVIKEDLSAQNLQLYKTAVQQFSFKNVWTNDGIVHISVGNQIHRIKSETEITELVNKLIPSNQSQEDSNDMTVYQVTINTGPIDAITFDDPSMYPSTSNELTPEEAAIAQVPPVGELVVIDPIFDETNTIDPVFNELATIEPVNNEPSTFGPIMSEEIVVEPDVDSILNEQINNSEDCENANIVLGNDTIDESLNYVEENNAHLDTASAVVDQMNVEDDPESTEYNPISDNTTVIEASVDNEPSVIQNPELEYITELIFNIRFNADNTIDLSNIDDIESDDDFAISIDIQEIYERNPISIENDDDDEATEASDSQDLDEDATDTDNQEHEDEVVDFNVESDNNNSTDPTNVEMASREESVLDENENQNEYDPEDDPVPVVYDLVDLETDEPIIQKAASDDVSEE